MAVDRRVVVGTYDNQNEVATEVRRLIDEGYPKEKITVYTNEENLDTLRDSQDVNVEAEGTVESTSGDTGEKSLWEEIKDAFSADTYDYDDAAQDPNYTRDDDVLYPYRDDIVAGKMIIVVEDYREDTDTNEGATVGIDRDIPENTNRTETTVREVEDDNLTEDEKIRLKDERLEVGKEEVEIRKERTEDVEEVSEDVKREELDVEAEGRTNLNDPENDLDCRDDR